MSDYGIRVSKAGYDVKTATPTQLIYSSKWSNFKIHSIITCSVVSTGANDIVTIANPLPYAPFFMAFVNGSSASDQWQLSSSGDGAGAVYITNTASSFPFTYYRSGTNDFYNSVFSGQFPDIGTTYTFKIIVFMDDPVGGANYSSAPIADYGIKVSQAGFDVKTTADTNLSMSSKFANLTIATSGLVSSTSPAVFTVNHNLGYKPIHLVLVKDPTTNKFRPLPTATTNSGVQYTCYVDATKLYLYNAENPTSVTFKYIIFNEAIAA